jgi:hypothetical protein
MLPSSARIACVWVSKTWLSNLNVPPGPSSSAIGVEFRKSVRSTVISACCGSIDPGFFKTCSMMRGEK